MCDVTCVFHDKATLGEGALWSDREQALFWVDIEQRRVCRFDPKSMTNRSVDVGQQVGTVVESQKGGLVAGLKDGVYSLDFESGVMTRWCDPLKGDQSSRLNDGKAGPDGRLYVGGMGPDGTQFLYRIERDGASIAAIERSITCSNGLCWTEDARTLYYIDSPQRVVWAYDFEKATGAVSNRRVVVDTTAENCVPDGMTIDVEGMIWVAFWQGWSVRRYDPTTGKELMRIELPVERVTSCAFGGPRHDQLYITTASIDMGPDDWKQQPLAGGLFVCEPGVRGRAAYQFCKE